jgi:molecular chaperone GrpE
MSTNPNSNQTDKQTTQADQAAAEPANPATEKAAEPAAELARLTAERAELNDRLLRTAAEFENYKRRVRKDTEDAGFRTLEGILEEILPPIDNLDRALVAASGTDEKSAKALIEGVQMVQKQFLAALERFSVKAFDVERGQPFDPQFHEAVQQVESDSLPTGSVAAVFQRGYKAGARLLRPAVVSVVKGSSEKTSN